jgi:hypothetical protein
LGNFKHLNAFLELCAPLPRAEVDIQYHEPLAHQIWRALGCAADGKDISLGSRE